jgi:hypothetical protein
MPDRLRVLTASVERYRWLLQTKLTATQRKSVSAMLGRKQEELKTQQGSTWSWLRRGILRGLKSRSDVSG